MRFVFPLGWSEEEIKAYLHAIRKSRWRRRYATFLWDCWWYQETRHDYIPLFLLAYMHQKVRKRFFKEGHLFFLLALIRDRFNMCTCDLSQNVWCQNCTNQMFAEMKVGPPERGAYCHADPIIRAEVEKLWGRYKANTYPHPMVSSIMALDRLGLPGDLIYEVMSPLSVGEIFKDLIRSLA